MRTPPDTVPYIGTICNSFELLRGAFGSHILNASRPRLALLPAFLPRKGQTIGWTYRLAGSGYANVDSRQDVFKDVFIRKSMLGLSNSDISGASLRAIVRMLHDDHVVNITQKGTNLGEPTWHRI